MLPGGPYAAVGSDTWRLFCLHHMDLSNRMPFEHNIVTQHARPYISRRASQCTGIM